MTRPGIELRLTLYSLGQQLCWCVNEETTTDFICQFHSLLTCYVDIPCVTIDQFACGLSDDNRYTKYAFFIVLRSSLCRTEDFSVHLHLQLCIFHRIMSVLEFFFCIHLSILFHLKKHLIQINLSSSSSYSFISFLFFLFLSVPYQDSSKTPSLTYLFFVFLPFLLSLFSISAKKVSYSSIEFALYYVVKIC